MKPFLQNTLFVIAGIVAGSAVNMGIVMVGPYIIPPPAGIEMTTAEGLRQAMEVLQPVHFIMPFFAHAIGTLAGAALAAILMSRPTKLLPPLIIGVFFLAGGIINIAMIPAPFWFSALDLLAAYMPMAWIGYKIVKSYRNE